MIARAIHSPALRARREAGFSIPEMIVTMFLLTVLMTVIVSLFVTFSSTFTRERQATESTTVAALGMNEVTKVVRAGTTLTRPDRPVFVSADKESLVLYSYLADSVTEAAKPIRVRFTINSQRQLVEERWNATKQSDSWTFPAVTTTPVSSRIIASRIIAPTAAQVADGQRYLFTYLSVDGTEIPSPVAANQLGNIYTVEVTMTVQADLTQRAAPVTITNRVGLPNLTASRLGLEG